MLMKFRSLVGLSISVTTGQNATLPLGYNNEEISTDLGVCELNSLRG